MREHLSETTPYLEEIAAAFGTKKFERTFAELYPKCENISIDYAVLEPRSAKGEHSSNMYCIRTDFAWTDLGAWPALYEPHAQAGKGNGGEEAGHCGVGPEGNYGLPPNTSVAP